MSQFAAQELCRDFTPILRCIHQSLSSEQSTSECLLAILCRACKWRHPPPPRRRSSLDQHRAFSKIGGVLFGRYFEFEIRTVCCIGSCRSRKSTRQSTQSFSTRTVRTTPQTSCGSALRSAPHFLEHAEVRSQRIPRAQNMIIVWAPHPRGASTARPSTDSTFRAHAPLLFAKNEPLPLR